MADRGGERDRVERRHLADPQRPQAGSLDLERDVERLFVGTVQPEGQCRFDGEAHSVVASAGWPSRMRPGSSREASLTWKCAVAVCASRKRRWSGALS